jgi:glycosyltransferase involved in cell wall biosynthesis
MATAGSLTVLHYTGYDDDRGGIMSAVRALAEAGRHVCVLGLNRGAVQRREPALPALELPRLDAERITLGNAWRARAVAAAVRAWLAESPRRIFHGHSRAGLLVGLWLRLMGEQRVVVSVHCYGRQRWFYRLAKNFLGPRLQWLTPAMKRYYYGGATHDWTDCIPNGLPGTPAARMRAWSGGRPLRIGGAGQLTANKRWDLPIAALAALPAGTPIEFWHAGGITGDAASAACERELKALVAQRGLGERVKWLGWLPGAQAWLRDVDVVVVPFHQESFSLVALEALYAGVPVIAARGGGPDDLIRHAENGWLVAPEDPAALAACFQALLRPEAWGTLRVDPAHLQRFAIVAITAQWTRLYAAL